MEGLPAGAAPLRFKGTHCWGHTGGTFSPDSASPPNALVDHREKEDVLAVYTRPRDPDRPLVCVDETSKQLLAESEGGQLHGLAQSEEPPAV
jgi:hypothetical protein